MIDRFQKETFFLSNFYPATFYYDRYEFKTVEHGYQMYKTFDEKERNNIIHTKTPSEAKKLGKQVTLRSDWEQVKISVMYELVRAKFKQNKSIRVQLLDTGDQELIEGNHWHDTFWGVCNDVGLNHLGKILMKVRDELRS